MPLIYACIAPHGGETIPEIAKDRKTAELFAETRRGMKKLANEMRKARPDTIVIASPHNLRLWKKISVVFSENSTGYLQSDSKKKRKLDLSVKCDTKLARQLYSAAVETRLPVVGANYGTLEGPTSDLPMDWGTFVPLWFFLDAERNADRKIDKPKVVIVSPSREIPMLQNVAFGKVLGKLAASERENRIAFVASADQAHAHRRDGPYGYHRAAKEFDQLAVDAVKKGELDSLLALDPRFIEDAKPDSVWQIAMLQGILSTAPFRAELISYEVPTYFGTLCASFIPS